MAITRRFQSGAEEQSADIFSASSNLLIGATPKTGVKNFVLDSGTSPTHGTVFIPATYQIRTGLFYSLGGSGGKSIFSFGDISLVTSETNILLNVSASTKDTLIGVNISGVYKHWGIDIKIDPTSGWVKVYIDGIEQGSFIGNTGSSTETDVIYGKNTSTNYNTQLELDDIYLDDTTGESAPAVCPILRFYYVKPNGDGNYSQWMGSDGNQVNNYQLVDEVPPSESDYVVVSGVDLFDSYAMETLALQEGQIIKAVIPTSFTKRGDTTEEIALGTRYSSTDLVGSDQAPAASADFLWERQETKPGGGAWDQASIDAFEALIKSRGAF